MELEFYTLDVFTDQRFAGNPLAVVLKADGLSGEQMLAITREFNLSETVFVLEPDNPAHSARIRIFNSSIGNALRWPSDSWNGSSSSRAARGASGW